MPNNEFVSAEGYAALVAAGVIAKEEAREYFGLKPAYQCLSCGKLWLNIEDAKTHSDDCFNQPM